MGKIWQREGEQRGSRSCYYHRRRERRTQIDRWKQGTLLISVAFTSFTDTRPRFSRQKASQLPNKISRPSLRKPVLARSSVDCAKETTLRPSVLTRTPLRASRRRKSPQQTSLLPPPMLLLPLRPVANMSHHPCVQVPAVLENQ